MGRIVIIGATSGIGQEVAKLFIRKGWRIGIAGRRTDRLEALQRMSPDLVEAEMIDVTSSDAATGLQRLIQKLGGMNIFLLCSGIGKQNRLLDAEIELSTVQTNVDGFTRMVVAAYQYFKGQGYGHLAIVSSIAGTKGLGVAPSYSATKRYQNIYIDALAQLAGMEKLDITFTDIRPGFVDTDLLADGKYPLKLKPDYVARQIVNALEKKKRRITIDRKYAVLVFFWRLIPEWIWERIRFIHTKG